MPVVVYSTSTISIEAFRRTVLASLIPRSRSKVGLPESFGSGSDLFCSGASDAGLLRSLSCAGVADVEEGLVVLPALRSRELLPVGVASRPEGREREDLLYNLDPEDRDRSLESLRWLLFLGDLDRLLFF